MSNLAYPRHVLNLTFDAFILAFKMLFKSAQKNYKTVEEFENAFAEFIGVKHALGIGSARKGLHLIFRSLGFDEGDEVIMPAYTFHFLPLAVIACGLKPVFVDVCEDTCNINPDLIEEKITTKTKAVVITHMFGQPCDMGQITQITQKHNLSLIEDCAHACGARYNNQRTGSIGDVSIFSFKMGKNLPCFGGGMITTNDDNIYSKIQQHQKDFPTPSKWVLLKDIIKTFFYFSLTQRYVFTFLAYPMIRLLDTMKFRWLDTHLEEKIDIEKSRQLFTHHYQLAPLQAAVGIRQLARLDEVNESRRNNAKSLIQELSGVSTISVPKIIAQAESTYLYFRICVPRLETFRQKLLKRGIDSKRDDMSACPHLEVFKDYGTPAPIAVRLTQHSIEVPNNPHLKLEEIKYIAGQIKAVSEELSQETESGA